MRAVPGVLSAPLSGAGGRIERLWRPSGALYRHRLHGMRHLLLLLPGAGAITVYRQAAQPKTLVLTPGEAAA